MPLRKRATEKARKAASGGDGPPAGQDPQVPGQPAPPTVADRGALRKRLRQTREARDVQLHELGALVMEMYRQNRHQPALVERKAREAIAADSEYRALAGALDSPIAQPLAGPPATASPVEGTPPSGGALAAAPPPSGSPLDAPPPSGSPLDAPPPRGTPAAAPPRTGSPLDAPPPAGSPLDAPPPQGDPLAAPPPTGAPVDAPASADGDGVPTYRVTSR